MQPGKGLYFPDTELRLDPLLPDDLLALDFAVREVDMIGYSFVQRSNDVACLQQEMAARRPDWRGDSVSLRRSRRVKRSKTFQRSSFKRRGGSLSGS